MSMYTIVVKQRLDIRNNASIERYLRLRSLEQQAPELSNEEYEARRDAYADCAWWMTKLILNKRPSAKVLLARLIRMAPAAKKPVYEEFFSLLERGEWMQED